MENCFHCGKSEGNNVVQPSTKGVAEETLFQGNAKTKMPVIEKEKRKHQITILLAEKRSKNNTCSYPCNK